MGSYPSTIWLIAFPLPREEYSTVTERICTTKVLHATNVVHTHNTALLSFFFQLTPTDSLHISGLGASRPSFPIRQHVPTSHKPQAQDRQRNANRHVQPPILAYQQGRLAVSALGCAEKAHAEDAADERGGQEKH